jgi:hypothetical protein
MEGDGRFQGFTLTPLEGTVSRLGEKRAALAALGLIPHVLIFINLNLAPIVGDLVSSSCNLAR